MFYLLYASSAPRKFDESSLVELLETSRRNNASIGVSGMLLYADGNFIQYIEGAEGPVRQLYDRISRDPRHRNLQILTTGETEARIFPDWSMGFRSLTRDEEAAIGRFDLSRATIENRLAEADNRLILTMMKQFYAAAYPDDD